MPASQRISVAQFWPDAVRRLAAPGVEAIRKRALETRESERAV